MMAALAGAQCGGPATPAGTPRPIGQKLALKGVPNFGQVTPTLYRGAQPSEEGFRNLAARGIGIVVDLRGDRGGERNVVTKLGMQYVFISWKCFNPRDEDFVKFLALLRENPGKKVFVHCKTGDDRTGMEIAAYRMVEEGWTASEARTEMEAFGFNFFHRRLCTRLGAYETSFPHRLETSPVWQDFLAGTHRPQPKP